ncbi:MAG: SufS family cysteine desulfurase [Alphaproteobacteria bacterium]
MAGASPVTVDKSKDVTDFSEILKYRADFPVLKMQMNGKPLAYLDSASSAQKPHAIMEAMQEIGKMGYSNIHRGLYKISQDITAAFEGVRPKIAALISAKTEREIIFTRNATEGINLVAQSWGRANLKAGDEIILSAMEHHANIVPWQLLQQEIDFQIRVIPVLESGELDLAAYKALLSEKTKFLGIVQMSNALGTINPVKDMIRTAKTYNPNIKVLVDGAQSIVHLDIDVVDIDCDFFAFTGHKYYGPSGTGVLYGKYEVLAEMPPYQGGGDMIERVSFDGTSFKEPPFRFEAGTPAIVPIYGLGAVVDYMSSFDLAQIQSYEGALLHYAMKKLQEIEGVTIHGAAKDRACIVPFTLEGAQPADVATILDQCGVAVRTGHHCCMPLMDALGLTERGGTIRASLAFYNNYADIDQLVSGVQKARELLL